MSQKKTAPSERTRVKRLSQRADYDPASIAAILDAQPLCSVAYCVDNKPFVVPTLQWREGEHVYWHGSSASAAMRRANARQVCMNVAILDGLVLARSGFHHSINYRSVTLYGVARKIEEEVAKEKAVKGFMDALIPGRWEELRPVNAKELKATTILTMPIAEASAKIRTGGPGDDEEDYQLPIWAGVVPITTTSGELIPDGRNLPGVDVPDHLLRYRFNP